MKFRWSFTAAWLLAACEPAPPVQDSSGLVLQELRTLRRELAETTRPSLDKAALAEVLEPLRTALHSLVQDQQDLRTRQAALTEELQRWTALVARTATAPPQEVQDLQARLAQIEAALKAQDTRHREVEALLQKALESTGDRLEQFLRRLETVRTGEPKPEPATGTPAKGEPPGGSPPAAGNGGMATLGPAGTDAAPRGARPLEPSLVALLGGGAVVLMAFLWRLFRAPADLDASPTKVAEPPADDLWAAAAMLGEAVDRLKQQGVPHASASGDPFAAVLASLRAQAAVPIQDDTEDEAVLDLAGPAAVAATPAAPSVAKAAADPAPDPAAIAPVPAQTVPAKPVPAETVPTAEPSTGSECVAPVGPPRHSRSFRPADVDAFAAAARALLGGEPRVLRRPAPRVEVRGGPGTAASVLVEFALLPARDQGQGERLLAALQQIARTT